jgi:hypothetical protein
MELRPPNHSQAAQFSGVFLLAPSVADLLRLSRSLAAAVQSAVKLAQLEFFAMPLLESFQTLTVSFESLLNVFYPRVAARYPFGRREVVLEGGNEKIFRSLR